MILIVLCYKIHLPRVSCSLKPHTMYVSSPLDGIEGRQEYQYGTIARVECTSALHKKEALTMSHYLGILSENQIDGFHIKGERKAIVLSEL